MIGPPWGDAPGYVDRRPSANSRNTQLQSARARETRDTRCGPVSRPDHVREGQSVSRHRGTVGRSCHNNCGFLTPDRRSLSGSHVRRPWVYNVLELRLTERDDKATVIVRRCRVADRLAANRTDGVRLRAERRDLCGGSAGPAGPVCRTAGRHQGQR